ncbi:hypothetical protein D3C76_1128450 [compost metagenome]
MQRQHRLGTCGELDLGHAVKGAAHAIPGVGRNLIIEHRRAVAAQLDFTANTVRVEAVTQQCKHHVGIGQLLHAHGIFTAEAAQQGAGQRRVQRRHFEFVSDRPADAVAPLKVVGVDRLRCAVERIDLVLEQPGTEVHQMQKRALAQALMRVRSVRAQQ